MRRQASGSSNVRGCRSVPNILFEDPTYSYNYFQDRCNLKNGMTDDVRDVFLNKHNEYRSQVARGLAKDRLGGTAPTAGKMARMSYDCKLEETMMKWLNKCIFRDSKSGNGENIWLSTDTRLNNTHAATMSTKIWFSELETKGIGKENILTEQVFNRGVGHYTQVASTKNGEFVQVEGFSFSRISVTRL
uniref:SCP extracellular domain containing protein n=1 Tax=Haemonchus contortus TaxID=6289 RepID=W6NGG4_HAECO